MKRRNVTRNALFTSIISLLLCVSMLVGTTFAWFTDSVESGRNVIAAGNLDVELYHSDHKETDAKVDGSTMLFDDVTPNLWEPGALAYENLQVKNLGTLALKYQLSLTVLDETVVNGYKISDVIMVGTKAGGFDASSREGIIGEVTEWTKLSDFKLDNSTKSLAAGAAAEKIGIVLYWQPNSNDIDNRYNLNNGQTGTLQLDIGVNLYATQVEAESDSFGDDYDEDAWDNAMVVLSEEDLIAALAAGETAIKLDDNITVDGPLVIPEGNTVALDLNGMDLSTTDPATGYAINNLGTLTLMDSQAGASTFNSRSIKARGIYNGYDPAGNHVTTAKLTILSGEYNAMGTNGGAAVYNYGTVEIKGGTFTSNGGYALNNQKTGKMTVSNASVTGGIYNLGDLIVSDSAVYQHISGRHAIYNNEAKLVINSGEFDSESGNELILADGQNSSVVINGGTFDKTAKSWLFGAATGKNISFVIKGGVFNGYVNMPENTVDTIRPYGDPIVVTGGTFNFDPTNWVDSGYKAVESSGAWTVVPKNAIATSDDLIAAIKAADEGDTLLLAPGEYSLRFTNNTAFNVDNLNIKGMDNAKLTVSSSEAWYGRVQGDNVTFENIHFTSSVGATGKATYRNCTFDNWTICASSGNKETYFNNCDIKGTLNTSTDFSSGDTYVTDSTVAKAEFSGAATMYFTNCQIGELISWDMATVLENCVVEKQDLKMEDQKVTTIETDENGLSWATNTANPDALVLYLVPSDYAETTLTVPEGATAIGNYAFAYNSNVKEVVLPTTVRDLGRGFDSSSVKKVVLNEGLEVISSRAFRSTTALKEVVISSSVKEIADNAFQKSSIKEIVIPANVKTIGEAAFASSEIEKVTFKGNTSIQGYAFRGCPNLREVHLEGNDVTFIASTLNGRNSMWFCNGESNNPNTSDITFYVANETVAARVKTAMGAEAGNIPVYVNGVLYTG